MNLQIHSKILMSIELDLYYCCICLNTETLDDRDFVQFSCCYQFIHKHCFILWICNPKYNDLAVSLSCPLCRRPIADINMLVREDELRREMRATTYYREDYISRIISKYYRDNQGIDSEEISNINTNTTILIRRTQTCMITLCLFSFILLTILMLLVKLLDIKY